MSITAIDLTSERDAARGKRRLGCYLDDNDQWLKVELKTKAHEIDFWTWNWQMGVGNRAAPELKPAAPSRPSPGGPLLRWQGPVFAWLSRESGRRAEKPPSWRFPSRPGSSYSGLLGEGEELSVGAWNSPFHEYSFRLSHEGVASAIFCPQRQLSDRLKSICLASPKMSVSVVYRNIAQVLTIAWPQVLGNHHTPWRRGLGGFCLSSLRPSLTRTSEPAERRLAGEDRCCTGWGRPKAFVGSEQFVCPRQGS